LFKYLSANFDTKVIDISFYLWIMLFLWVMILFQNLTDLCKTHIIVNEINIALVFILADHLICYISRVDSHFSFAVGEIIVYETDNYLEEEDNQFVSPFTR